MTSEHLDYTRDVLIDETALDVEWLEQPHLMFRYSRYSAECRRVMDDAKERLDFIRAKLDAEIRNDPEKFGITKLTESAIQATIILQPEYQEAARAYNDAKYEYEVSQAAVRAIDQRKTALENLVKLLSVSYFAGPKTPRDLTKEALERQAQRQSDRRVRIRRRRGASGDDGGDSAE